MNVFININTNKKHVTIFDNNKNKINRNETKSYGNFIVDILEYAPCKEKQNPTEYWYCYQEEFDDHYENNKIIFNEYDVVPKLGVIINEGMLDDVCDMEAEAQKDINATMDKCDPNNTKAIKIQLNNHNTKRIAQVKEKYCHLGIQLIVDVISFAFVEPIKNVHRLDETDNIAFDPTDDITNTKTGYQEETRLCGTNIIGIVDIKTSENIASDDDLHFIILFSNNWQPKFLFILCTNKEDKIIYNNDNVLCI